VYSAQGNILLGQQIVDSIADRFERSTGRLADRLMYALLGARVAGADTRCAPFGTSSHGAFIQVARPGDRSDSFMLDLRVSLPAESTIEPLDELEALFDAWRVAGIDRDELATSLDVFASERSVGVRFTTARRSRAGIAVFDTHGARLLQRDLGIIDAGDHLHLLDGLADSAHGTYFIRLTTGRGTMTRAVVIGSR
jgi:hypothetical protein